MRHRMFKLVLAVIILSVVAAFFTVPANADVYGRKKFFFYLVDANGDQLEPASLGSAVIKTHIYESGQNFVDANVFRTESAATTAGVSYLTADSNGVIEFWGISDSFCIRVTDGWRYDLYTNCYVTKHRLVFIGRYPEPQDISPTVSMPGMIWVHADGNNAYIGIGVEGNTSWAYIDGDGHQ